MNKLKDGMLIVFTISCERKNMVQISMLQEETVTRQIGDMGEIDKKNSLSQVDENFFKGQMSDL